MDDNRGVQLRVLGPLEVGRDGRSWSAGGPKERRLLAVLVLHLGEVVSVDAIAGALWDGAPPRSATKSVQAYVARLRARLSDAFGGAVVQTSPPGYRLVLDRLEVDAYAFVDLVGRARQSMDRGEPESAESCLAEAFALWRGEPYAEFADSPFFAGAVRWLTETRLAGLETRLVAGLVLGRHVEVVGEAQVLVHEHPLREGLWVQLVTALYRCGRQADALAALRRVRAVLAEEIGADPSVELRALEQRVLAQDPTLAAPHRSTGAPPLPPELDLAGRLFVGRVAELAWLHRAWAEVQAAGAARLVVITGPAGSGRTRLLAEFAAQQHRSGVVVHYGRLGAGLSILDDVGEGTVGLLSEVAGHGRMLCVAVYDPDNVAAVVRDAVSTAAPRELVLGPLSRGEVTQIAAGVAGTLDADLVDEILVAAGGWPGAVETVTAGLVAQRATRRVSEAVGRARPARHVLAAARSDVIAGVRELGRVRAWHTAPVPGAARAACPYKGLAAYESGDAPLFHGREELVATLCARLVDTAFVAVLGASGVGKSSLVRAGLLPALAHGVLPGLAGAPQFVVRPAERLPEPDGSAVVVVDQFEELFTASHDDAVRHRYLDELTGLASRPGVRVMVVLRGDFVGACATHPRLAELVGEGSVLVGPMGPDEVGRVVELPARQVGLRAEPALVDAVVADVHGQSGALPLLSTALVEVWQHRSGAALTAAAYHRAGGVGGAVARLGEAAYTGLDEPTRVAARRLLLRLADTGESGVVVRRRVPRAELDDDPATTVALQVLVARRLVSVGERGVEVTHEALLRFWPRLVGWLAADEQGRVMRRHLGPAAVDWDRAGRPDADLYRGARLAAAVDWAGEQLAEVTGVEREFLTASRDYADRELREQRARADRQARARRRLQAALAAVLVLLLVTCGATWLAVDRARAAADASRRSLAGRLGALALVTADLDRSLLLAVQAVRTHDDWETRGDLLAVLSRSPQALHQVRGASEHGTLAQLTLTRDGSTVVAAGGGGGRMFTWDATTMAATAEPTVIAQRTESVIAGPDPSTVFVGAGIAVGAGTQGVIYWDTRTRRTLATYRLPRGVPGSTRRPAVSSDNRVLAVPTRGPALLLYSVATGTLQKQVPLGGVAGDVWRAGALLVTTPAGTDTAVFVDPAAGRIVRTIRLPFAGNIVPSPDGHTLLVFAASRAALVGSGDGRVIRDFAGATRAAAVAAFSPDGRLLAVGGDDQLIGVWDAATGELRDTLRGHAAPVNGLVFAADDTTLYTASQDNTVIAWDVTGDRSFAARPRRNPILPAPRSPTNGLTTIVTPLVAWSGDRRRVYVATADGSAATLIDTRTGQPVGAPPVLAADPTAAVPTGDLDRQAIFTTTVDGQLLRLNLRTGAKTSRSTPPLNYYGVAVSGDGRVLASAVEDPTTPTAAERGLDLLDPHTLTVTRHLPPLDVVPYTIWLNTDGSLLAATEDSSGRVEMWDTRTARRRWLTDIGSGQGSVIALAPDHHTMIVGTAGGAVVLLDTATGRVLARHTLRLSSIIASAEFSPDGNLVAIGGNDGQAHLLTAATLDEVGALPLATGATWAFVSYHPDGSQLSAVDERGHVVRWDPRPEAWIRRACAIAGRDLSPTEWRTYLPDTPYRRTCTTG